MYSNYFSKNYDEAKKRFIDVCQRLKATMYCYGVMEERPELTIDVASIGKGERAVVISSGIHGIEGFFGSAVQLAYLYKLEKEGIESSVRYIFIHAVNPYGFAELRRVNENNIDLNRNFLPDKSYYTGYPEGYDSLESFLNPTEKPSPFEPFLLKYLLNIYKYTLPKMIKIVASGQYEYPKGLFFGGKEKCPSGKIIEDNYSEWFNECEYIVHIDLHTGLGEYGKYKLFIHDTNSYATEKEYEKLFKKELLMFGNSHYGVSGQIGDWLQEIITDRRYLFVTAEFGTYSILNVFKNLRRENQIHFYGDCESASTKRVKQKFLDCFAPFSKKWRHSVVIQGIEMIDNAVMGIHHL